ncbi:hypothetical protein GGF50DRAFT_121789 [Schizophyllum commune]
MPERADADRGPRAPICTRASDVAVASLAHSPARRQRQCQASHRRSLATRVRCPARWVLREQASSCGRAPLRPASATALMTAHVCGRYERRAWAAPDSQARRCATSRGG